MVLLVNDFIFPCTILVFMACLYVTDHVSKADLVDQKGPPHSPWEGIGFVGGGAGAGAGVGK